MTAVREGLLTRLFMNRLPAPRWPLAAVSSAVPGTPALLAGVVREVAYGLPDAAPAFRAQEPTDPSLQVATMVCDIVRKALEQRQRKGTASTPQLERIRTRLRLVENVLTGERFHRDAPLP